MRRRDQEDHQATGRAGKASRRRDSWRGRAGSTWWRRWQPGSPRVLWCLDPEHHGGGGVPCPGVEHDGGGVVRCPGAASCSLTTSEHERKRRDTPPLLLVLVHGHERDRLLCPSPSSVLLVWRPASVHLRLIFVLQGSRPSFTSSTHPALSVKGGAQAALKPLLPSVSPSRPSTVWDEHENPLLQEMDEDVRLRWGNQWQLPDGGPDPSAVAAFSATSSPPSARPREQQHECWLSSSHGCFHATAPFTLLHHGP